MVSFSGSAAWNSQAPESMTIIGGMRACVGVVSFSGSVAWNSLGSESMTIMEAIRVFKRHDLPLHESMKSWWYCFEGLKVIQPLDGC